MSGKEVWEEMHELAQIMDGWFDDMYVDTGLRFRKKPKSSNPEEETNPEHLKGEKHD